VDKFWETKQDYYPTVQIGTDKESWNEYEE